MPFACFCVVVVVSGGGGGGDSCCFSTLIFNRNRSCCLTSSEQFSAILLFPERPANSPAMLASPPSLPCPHLPLPLSPFSPCTQLCMSRKFEITEDLTEWLRTLSLKNTGRAICRHAFCDRNVLISFHFKGLAI